VSRLERPRSRAGGWEESAPLWYDDGYRQVSGERRVNSLCFLPPRLGLMYGQRNMAGPRSRRVPDLGWTREQEIPRFSVLVVYGPYRRSGVRGMPQSFLASIGFPSRGTIQPQA